MRALARYPGLHLAAFAVADAVKARSRLVAADFRVRPLVEMKRPVGTATGTGTAAFTIARVEPDVMPEGRIQMLTHHTEHTVWQPRWLAHPNTAIGLIDVVIAVANVEEAALRFVRFTGRSATPTIIRPDRAPRPRWRRADECRRVCGHVAGGLRSLRCRTSVPTALRCNRLRRSRACCAAAG